MRNKRVLLASTALALFAGVGQAQARDLYISVLGGANFLADQSVSNPTDTPAVVSLDADTGFLLGAAFGTYLDNWCKNLRTEFEVSYRRNDLGGAWTSNGPVSGEAGFLEGNMSTFAIMANVWYDVPVSGKLRAYGGGGAGWARMDGQAVYFETLDSGAPVTPPDADETQTVTNSGFVWHVGLGINYEVMEEVDFGIGYRYFVGPRFEGFHPDNSSVDLDNENHLVQLNLTIGINPP